MNDRDTYVKTADDNYVRASEVQTPRSHVVGSTLRFIVVAAFIAAIVIVAMDNRDDVRVGYAFGETQAPIWIVLVLAALAGVIIGWLLKHRPRRHTHDVV